MLSCQYINRAEVAPKVSCSSSAQKQNPEQLGAFIMDISTKMQTNYNGEPLKIEWYKDRPALEENLNGQFFNESIRIPKQLFCGIFSGTRSINLFETIWLRAFTLSVKLPPNFHSQVWLAAFLLFAIVCFSWAEFLFDPPPPPFHHREGPCSRFTPARPEITYLYY